MAPAISLLASRLTALRVKDEQISSIAYGSQLSKRVRWEFFYHDHNEGTYHIQLDQYCNWYNFTDLKALCSSSAEAEKFKFWNSTHLVYPFWEDPKNLSLLLLTNLFYLLGWNVVTCRSKNPSHPNISMHILLLFSPNFLWYWPGEFV